tara:strand:+ start:816 stop:1652 length:837 start_codon:yes stop_codon:yes gene_type:complete
MLPVYKYGIHDIVTVESDLLKTNYVDMCLVPYETINHIYTLEYKFKDKRMSNLTKVENPIKFDDIRSNLNKLSKKTYNIHFKYIISSIHFLNDQNTPDLFLLVFRHLSTNIFMSEPYAKLNNALVHIFPQYETLFYKQFSDFIAEISQISIAKTSTYDEMCQTNKKKDSYRAQTAFYMESFIASGDFERVQQMIVAFQNYVMTNIEIQNKRDEVEVLCDLIYLCFTSNINLRNLCEIKTIVSNNDNIISKKENKTIGRRIIFKHMDMHDIFVKQGIKL